MWKTSVWRSAINLSWQDWPWRTDVQICACELSSSKSFFSVPGHRREGNSKAIKGEIVSFFLLHCSETLFLPFLSCLTRSSSHIRAYRVAQLKRLLHYINHKRKSCKESSIRFLTQHGRLTDLHFTNEFIQLLDVSRFGKGYFLLDYHSDDCTVEQPSSFLLNF